MRKVPSGAMNGILDKQRPAPIKEHLFNKIYIYNKKFTLKKSKKIICIHMFVITLNIELDVLV